jgi:sodium-dependent dicarboxylate transporter 2/3/5
LFGLLVTDFLLTFLIPSGAARVVILCTIAIGLVHTFGLKLKSNMAKGMILTLTYSATIFDKFILAGAASILARGLIESIGNVEISWGLWFIAFLPLTLLTIFACWYLTLKLFPPEVAVINDGKMLIKDELKKLGPMTREQYKVLFLVILATLLWGTDSFHNISPSVIGIGFGIIGFLPVIGVLDKEDLNEINFPIIILLGSVLSMGKILLNSSVLDRLTELLFSWIVPNIHNEVVISTIMYWYANFFHLFLGNETAMLSASLPVVINFALNNGYDPVKLGMIWTLAAGGKVFIYQSGVLALGYSFGAFNAKDLFKLGLFLIIVEAVLVASIVPVYWGYLGL